MKGIKEKRAEMGVTQVQLAALAGMDPATLNRIEQGKANPNLKTIERLADALGVGVADFFPKAQPPLPFEEVEQRRRLAPATGDEAEALLGPARVLNEVLHQMQEAYAPGEQLDWGRDALEEIGALIAKTALIVASGSLAAGGSETFVEAVQVIGRAERVVRLLDERAAAAPVRGAEPPENVARLEELREMRRAVQERAEDYPEQRAG